MTTSSSESRSHAKWEGQYHGVCIPQGRQKAWYGKMRTCRGPVWRALAGQRGSTIVAGPRVQDPVHLLSRMPPPDAVAAVIGDSKGTSALAVACQWGGRQRHLHGERLWARGYAVSTVGVEAEQMRASRKPQEPFDAPGSAEPGEC
jgi:putative transposase